MPPVYPGRCLFGEMDDNWEVTGLDSIPVQHYTEYTEIDATDDTGLVVQ